MDLPTDRAGNRRFARAGFAFAAIGLGLYAALWLGAEMLLMRQGHANPFYRIEQSDPAGADWIVLGTSHAMPLDFGDSRALLESATGRFAASYVYV